MVKKQDTPTEPADDKVDWEGMEPDWRAGIVSVTELERRFKVSRTAIRKHWKKLGIERDLTAKIQGEATAMVQRAEANGGQLVPARVRAPQPDTQPTDAETVTTNAVMQATVILRQRHDIRRAQSLCGELLTELESQSFDRQLYQELDTLMRKAAGAGRVDKKAIAQLQAIYARATTTASRIDNTKKLSETMKLLVELERKVLGITDGEAPPANPNQAVDAVAGAFNALRQRFQDRLGAKA